MYINMQKRRNAQSAFLQLAIKTRLSSCRVMEKANMPIGAVNDPASKVTYMTLFQLRN